MAKILEVKNISKKYQSKDGETIALENVNFSIDKGEFVSVIRTKWLWKIYIIICNCRIRRKKQWRNLHRKQKRNILLKKQKVKALNIIS